MIIIIVIVIDTIVIEAGTRLSHEGDGFLAVVGFW
jgi:hypothetical protein